MIETNEGNEYSIQIKDLSPVLVFWSIRMCLVHLHILEYFRKKCWRDISKENHSHWQKSYAVEVKSMFGRLLSKQMMADKSDICDLHFTFIFWGTW